MAQVIAAPCNAVQYGQKSSEIDRERPQILQIFSRAAIIYFKRVFNCVAIEPNEWPTEFTSQNEFGLHKIERNVDAVGPV